MKIHLVGLMVFLSNVASAQTPYALNSLTGNTSLDMARGICQSNSLSDGVWASGYEKCASIMLQWQAARRVKLAADAQSSAQQANQALINSLVK